MEQQAGLVFLASGQTNAVSYVPFVRTFVKLFVQIFVWKMAHYSLYNEYSFLIEYSAFSRIFGHLTEYLAKYWHYFMIGKYLL